jgi:hypothetical protein
MMSATSLTLGGRERVLSAARASLRLIPEIHSERVFELRQPVAVTADAPGLKPLDKHVEDRDLFGVCECDAGACVRGDDDRFGGRTSGVGLSQTVSKGSRLFWRQADHSLTGSHFQHSHDAVALLSGESWAKVSVTDFSMGSKKAPFPGPLEVAGAGFEPATSGL